MCAAIIPHRPRTASYDSSSSNPNTAYVLPYQTFCSYQAHSVSLHGVHCPNSISQSKCAFVTLTCLLHTPNSPFDNTCVFPGNTCVASFRSGHNHVPCCTGLTYRHACLIHIRDLKMRHARLVHRPHSLLMSSYRQSSCAIHLMRCRTLPGWFLGVVLWGYTPMSAWALHCPMCMCR